VLDAALNVLIEDGVDRMTMLAVAKRAGASKETLYSWFGNRDGLLRALIERNADGSAERIQAALGATATDEVEVRTTLEGYAAGLLRLLTSPGSVALNRAAMSDGELAALLLASGRHRVGPIVEAFLERQAKAGNLTLTMAPPAAFELLYGLVVQDIQIRVLLGESAPSSRVLTARAKAGVGRFLQLTSQDS